MTGVPLSELLDDRSAAALSALGVAQPSAADDRDDDAPVEIKADPVGALEHKGAPGGATQVLEADPVTGRVTALVSVTGVEDKVKDVIEPGAYTKTIAAREPIGVWSHDDKTWVARTESAKELPPGDPFFRDIKTMDGKPWPAQAGGVLVEAQFNLETPHGAAAFSDVKFFQGKTGWSIGYRATKAHRNPRTGVRHIKELDWFEFSPVMVGAASQPLTLSVKSLAQPVDADDDTGLIGDEALVELGADELKAYAELKASLGLEVKDRVRTASGVTRFGQPLGSVIIKDSIPKVIGDDDLAGMIADAAKKGDADEVAQLRKAAAMKPEDRRKALESAKLATPGERSTGDSGQGPAQGGAMTATRVTPGAKTAPDTPASAMNHIRAHIAQTEGRTDTGPKGQNRVTNHEVDKWVAALGDKTPAGDLGKAVEVHRAAMKANGGPSAPSHLDRARTASAARIAERDKPRQVEAKPPKSVGGFTVGDKVLVGGKREATIENVDGNAVLVRDAASKKLRRLEDTSKLSKPDGGAAPAADGGKPAAAPAAAKAPAFKKGDNVFVSGVGDAGRESELVSIDGDKATVIDHVTGRTRTVDASTLKASKTGGKAPMPDAGVDAEHARGDARDAGKDARSWLEDHAQEQRQSGARDGGWPAVDDYLSDADDIAAGKATPAEMRKFASRLEDAFDTDGALEEIVYAMRDAARRLSTSSTQKSLDIVNARRDARGLYEVTSLPDEVKAMTVLELALTPDDVLDAHIDADPFAEFKGSSASLNRSPKKNWIEQVGGQLPPYVREVARSIEKTGKTLSAAIRIAIGRIKTWARGGGGVKADTVAKAAKAVAQWEALKARAGAKFDSTLLDQIERKGAEAYGVEVKDFWDALCAEEPYFDVKADVDGLIVETKAAEVGADLAGLFQLGSEVKSYRSAVADEVSLDDLLAERASLS